MSTTMLPDEPTLLAYVDGTLPQQGRQEVEAAMAARPDLAREVMLLQASRLPYQSAFAQEVLAPVPEALRARVAELSSVASASQRLGAESHAARHAENPLGPAHASPVRRAIDALRRWAAFAQPHWGWVAAAEFSVILLLTGLFAFGERPADSSFQLLGAKAQKAEGVSAFVIFDGTATERAMRQALAAAGATIVNGPTETGAYIVRLPTANATAGIESMRHQPGVRVIEQIGAAPPTR
jgi:hypothetical protein